MKQKLAKHDFYNMCREVRKIDVRPDDIVVENNAADETKSICKERNEWRSKIIIF